MVCNSGDLDDVIGNRVHSFNSNGGRLFPEKRHVCKLNLYRRKKNDFHSFIHRFLNCPIFTAVGRDEIDQLIPWLHLEHNGSNLYAEGFDFSSHILRVDIEKSLNSLLEQHAGAYLEI